MKINYSKILNASPTPSFMCIVNVAYQYHLCKINRHMWKGLVAEWASAHQLGARGEKPHTAESRELRFHPHPAHFHLDDHRTG